MALADGEPCRNCCGLVGECKAERNERLIDDLSADPLNEQFIAEASDAAAVRRRRSLTLREYEVLWP